MTISFARKKPKVHPQTCGDDFPVCANGILCFNVAMQNVLLAFVDDIYEDLELWYPKLRLEEAGYSVRLAAHHVKGYSGKHGYPATADLLLEEARSADFAVHAVTHRTE